MIANNKFICFHHGSLNIFLMRYGMVFIDQMDLRVRNYKEKSQTKNRKRKIYKYANWDI